jgi:hypothetical protein
LSARGSATESAALLDVLCRLGILDEHGHQTGKEMLVREVSMLIKLAQSVGLKRQEQALPLASFRPPIEAVEHRLPRSEIRWKITPRNACAAPPQYGFDESTIFVCRPASSALRLQKQVDL